MRVLPLLACLALPLPALAWTGPVHERVALQAQRLMPPSLAAQLEKHRGELVRGATDPDREALPQAHGLHPDGSGGSLDREVAAGVDRAIQILRSQGTFAELARELGKISHLVSDAAFPLNASGSDAREDDYYADYGRYAERKLDKYPPIFDGYESFGDAFDVADYVRRIAERANRGYPIVAAGYYPPKGGPLRDSRGFDDRGPVFGVTQLAYVRAVSATANLWLYVWREAHGDLSNTPHYQPSRAASGARNRAGAPQRP